MLNEIYFQNKNIWITGASSGIGRAFAIQLSALGAFVILSSRNTEKLKQVQSELQHPIKSFIFAIDMEDEKSIAEASKKILDQYEVDILIHGAGISQRSSCLETSFETEDKIMKTNFQGVTRLTKPVLNSMSQRRKGHFVILSSVSGKIGTPFRSSYAASKHALHGYFDSLRAEESDNGISVTIICPGYINTNISQNALLGDGSPHVKKDANSENGMNVDLFVKKALKAISQKKSEVNIGGKEIFGIILKRFLPNILNRIVKNINHDRK